MAFDYERQMAEPAEQWLRSQELATKREFPTPWGICDLVGCSLNKNKIKKRLALGQTRPIGSQLRVFLLSQIPDHAEGNSIELEKLLKKFAPFLDEATIQLEIDRLIRDNFVRKAPCETLQQLNGWRPLHKKLIALELKLTRVPDALRQAIGNLEFADESYVGLPAETAKRVISSKRKRAFIENGIGILAVESICKVVLRPKRLKPRLNSPTQIHCVERFWRTYPKDTSA